MHRCRYLTVSVFLLVTSLAISSDIGGVGTANPNSLAAGQVTLLTVAVTPGADPASTDLAVSCDLSPIGGSAAQAFFDDGTNGDAIAGDNTFSYLATVNTSTIPGNKTLSCSITDAESRSASVSITLNITEELVTKACRSAGFWGTHAGTECPKKQPNCGSQNITQDVITAAGGCLAVCGQEVTNTTLNNANSAVEAICVSPSGDIELQLARQLTAATLNCVMSNSTATTSCSNGNCTTCGNLSVSGQDINIGTLVTACNDACIGSAATTTLGGVEVNCIDALNCFNNGGVFNAGTGPSTATCQTGTCSIDNSPCGIEGLPSCPTVIVGGIAQSQTCVPLPNNCESRPLCQVAIPGNLTPGTPGLLCFDATNADVECPQPPAAAPAICTPAPGPAGSVNECNSAIKNQCTLIEGSCGAGNGATCLTPVADIQVTKGVANAPLSGICDNTLTYDPSAQGIESGSCPNFCYKIVVSNDGAESLTSVTVSDPDLPGLTVPTSLAPGQTVTIFASKTWCAADAPAPNGHVNTVTASGVGTPSGIAVSESASATVVVQGGNEACCYSDICGPNPGSCEDRTSESCTSAGGLPQGPGTNCAKTICVLISTPQACCLSNRTCIWIAPDACSPMIGAIPMGCFTQCLGDSNGNGVDDICETP